MIFHKNIFKKVKIFIFVIDIKIIKQLNLMLNSNRGSHNWTKSNTINQQNKGQTTALFINCIGTDIFLTFNVIFKISY